MDEDASGGRRARGAEVRTLCPRIEVPVEAGALLALRAASDETFDERFEEVAFEVSERLARIGALVRRGDLGGAAREAGWIGECLSRIGLAAVASVAEDLRAACGAPDAIAAEAVCARLLRAGEEGLIRAAELSVELVGCAEGA